MQARRRRPPDGPHHLASPAAKVRDLENSNIVRGRALQPQPINMRRCPQFGHARKFGDSTERARLLVSPLRLTMAVPKDQYPPPPAPASGLGGTYTPVAVAPGERPAGVGVAPREWPLFVGVAPEAWRSRDGVAPGDRPPFAGVDVGACAKEFLGS
jgi:hypothetical protein